MNYLDSFVLHKDRKRKYLAKGNNYVTLDETWSFGAFDDSISFAVDDFSVCLKDSFGVTLGKNGDKLITLNIESGLNHGFRIEVTDTSIAFFASDNAALVQALFYAEDMMKLFGDASLEKGTAEKSPLLWPRIATSALAGGAYTREYLNIILHYGYNGVMVYYHDEQTLALIREMGLLCYYCGEADPSASGYDGVVTEDTKFACENVIYDLSNSGDPKASLAELPEGASVILSFDGGQSIEKDGVAFDTVNGSIVMSEPSDSFCECFKLAKEKSMHVICANSASGRTSELSTVPYLPAMMQWFMRHQALKEWGAVSTLESDSLGFIPSIVGEFTKHLFYTGCDEGGILIQKLAIAHFGAENSEKVMMAFKKVTDGANWLIYNYADKSGPMWFGPAYPLVEARLYEYDFDRFDITYETDVNLKAADGFNKAAMILGHIDNDEAKELAQILLFAVNTLVSSANAKRWYRRLDAVSRTDADYKKKFLYEQMLKIGEQEIKNAYDTADILIACPYLSSNNCEELCTPDALDAKIRLTQAAVGEITKKIH